MNKVTADHFPLPFDDSEGNVVQLTRLTHRHHAIMDYMLANPTRKMSEVAAEFKVTGAWLSTVRNSDLFKARLAERRRLMDEDQAHRIGQKMFELAEDSIEAMSDIIADTDQDGKLKHEIAKTALENIGFLGKGAGQQSAEQKPPGLDHIEVSVLVEARQSAMGGSTARAKDIDGESIEVRREDRVENGGRQIERLVEDSRGEG